MKVGIALVCGVFGLSATALAEWSITNKDHSSYELKKTCASNGEDWSIAGGVTKKLSIPAGATQCMITMENGGGTCTVKDGESCTIQSGKIAK